MPRCFISNFDSIRPFIFGCSLKKKSILFSYGDLCFAIYCECWSFGLLMVLVPHKSSSCSCFGLYNLLSVFSNFCNKLFWLVTCNRDIPITYHLYENCEAYNVVMLYCLRMIKELGLFIMLIYRLINSLVSEQVFFHLALVVCFSLMHVKTNHFISVFLQLA